MSTEVYRKYLDIINENSQAVQLDEGMMQDLKAKASALMGEFKQIKGIGAAYKQAKMFAPELKQVFMSAKSGKDVMDGIQQVVASKTGNNALTESTSNLIGGTFGTVGGLSILAYEKATGFFDVLVNLLLNDTGANQAAAAWFLGVPVMCAIAGAFLLWSHHDRQKYLKSLPR